MAKTKVFTGWAFGEAWSETNGRRQVNYYVRSTSQAKALAALNAAGLAMNPTTMRNYWSTLDEDHAASAIVAEPDRVYVQPDERRTESIVPYDPAEWHAKASNRPDRGADR